MRAGAHFAEARDRAVSELAERDRRLAHELAAGVLRGQRELDAQLELTRADRQVHDILRLGVYQLRCLNRVPAHAAVSTSVELARETAGEGAAAYVNHALRRIARVTTGRPGGGVPDRAVAADRTPTHPEWQIARWRRRFGPDETTRLLEWNDTRPALVLQPLRWDAPTLRGRLVAVGITVSEAPFAAGLRISGPMSLRPPELPGYAEGAFIVQDPAQALVVRFAAIPAGARVYDACAAPGGKTVALAAAGAAVTAGDARHERVGRLREVVRRTGVAARLIAADLLAAPFRAGTWDAVLVDAPCSATGTMARHPDARWRLSARAIERLALRQAALLEAASGLVRPGGVLVYATCSLELEENEERVEEFLHRHPDFARRPVPGIPAELTTPAGDFQSLPHRHGIDGAYAARLGRSA